MVGQGGVEEGEAVVGGDGGQAVSGDAGLVEFAEVGGHAGGGLPVAPGQAGGGGWWWARVEDGVGGGVVGLAGLPRVAVAEENMTKAARSWSLVSWCRCQAGSALACSTVWSGCWSVR
nr:hypothetical protein [Mycobacterium riyadhense]